MTLRQLVQADWMTPDEKKLAKWFVNHLARLFRERGVPQNPLLVVRLNDALVSYLLARRAESLLGFGQAEDGTAIPPPPAAYDLVGKAHERLRRATRELEDFCARAGKPIDTGIADRLQPLMQHTRTITEKLGTDEA
jgi:hypothetical protein